MNPINRTDAATPKSPIQKVVSRPVHKELPADAPKQLTGSPDRVEISGMSALLTKLQQGGDIRADKVADIKAQIAAGKYMSDDKLDIAADRLLDELNA